MRARNVRPYKFYGLHKKLFIWNVQNVFEGLDFYGIDMARSNFDFRQTTSGYISSGHI